MTLYAAVATCEINFILKILIFLHFSHAIPSVDDILSNYSAS